MSLPQELEQCLNKHVQHILKRMAPDGVFLYLSGAKLLNDDDHREYNNTTDNYDKNHAILRVVSRHGRKGFDAFLEALETTQQTGIVDRLRATLNEKYNNEAIAVGGIGEIKNGAGSSGGDKEIGCSSVFGGDSAVLGQSRTTSVGGSYTMVVPRPRMSGSPMLSRSRSVSRMTPMTPLTPPLTEAELDEHLTRLKSLLHKISSTHGDRFCRQEATDLLGEMEEAGDAMVDRIRQLTEENAEKERELRRAKFMVRGMETEINRLKTIRTPDLPDNDHYVRPSGSKPIVIIQSSDNQASEKSSKSKLCVVL